MLNKKPSFIGKYYPSTFDKLDKSIRDSFMHKLGPGDFPTSRNKNGKFVVISPHWDYGIAGPGMAWSFKEIAEHDYKDVYILLGANHTRLGTDFSTYLFSGFEMPFGLVNVDKKNGKEVIKNYKKLINEYEAHKDEYSIELQLPFLQFANKDKLNELKILPIVVKSRNYEECVKLADAIAELEVNYGIIVSSNLLYFGRMFNYMPFVYSKKENITIMNNMILDYIKNLDAKGLLEYVNDKKITTCGVGAIAVAIEVCRNIGLKKANVLQHYNSYEINNDHENIISFASVKFE